MAYDLGFVVPVGTVALSLTLCRCPSPTDPPAGVRAAVPESNSLLSPFFADIQEIFGAHYELPELGPLGANGLANARDFESPVASFDVDQSPWESECPLLTWTWKFFDVRDARQSSTSACARETGEIILFLNFCSSGSRDRSTSANRSIPRLMW